jgi:hypothetical protein
MSDEDLISSLSCHTRHPCNRHLYQQIRCSVVIMMNQRKMPASRLAWPYPTFARQLASPARGGALKDSVDCIASTDLYTCTSSCVCKPRPGSAGGSGADRGTISCRPAFAAEPMVTPSERLALSPSSFLSACMLLGTPQMVLWMIRSRYQCHSSAGCMYVV